MTITKSSQADELTVALTGRLDTNTSPQLESELKDSLDGIKKLIIDLGALEYISSAGLRVLLSAQKIMKKQGGMVVRGANESVLDVFEVTGFSDILTIEQV